MGRPLRAYDLPATNPKLKEILVRGKQEGKTGWLVDHENGNPLSRTGVNKHLARHFFLRSFVDPPQKPTRARVAHGPNGPMGPRGQGPFLRCRNPHKNKPLKTHDFMYLFDEARKMRSVHTIRMLAESR